MSKTLPLLTGACLVTLAALGACGRIKEVGQQPELTDSVDGPEFHAMSAAAYSAPHFPGATIESPSLGSLWTTSPMSLVSDKRATERGDILTVVIEIDDKAEFQNTSGRSRSATDKVGIPNLMGIPQRIDKMLPDDASMEDLADASANSSYKGSGNISRREKLTLRVAATIIDILPNGVLRVQGSQEVRVNNEVRELTVSGFVRPADIGRRNEIAYDRIAGARISYGGRGNITDVQQPRYGQQIADILLPY